MKGYIFSLFLLLVSFSAKADYFPTMLYEMILEADKIIYGEIVEMDSLTYTLKVEGNLTGDEVCLKIEKFRNWACAHRWTNYALGQKLLLFLRAYEGHLYAMSGGNEGELPLHANAVFINGLSLSSPPAVFPDTLKYAYAQKHGYLISKNYKLYGADYFGHKVNLQSFLATVSFVRGCFKLHYGDYHKLEKVELLCPKMELEAKADSDTMLKWVWNSLKKRSHGNVVEQSP